MFRVVERRGRPWPEPELAAWPTRNREIIARLARDLPQFLEKGTQVVQTIAAVGQRLMEAGRSAMA